MADELERRPRSKRRDPETTLTIHDVAKRANVSTATVSRVANGNYPVSAATRTRVEKAMRELGYVVNAHARALAGSTTRLVGIVINEIVDPFFAYIARGVQLEAAENNRMCLVCNTQGDDKAEIRFVDLLLEQRADVVILVGGAYADPAYEETVATRARQLHHSGSRLVLCGRPTVSLGDDAPVATVEYDNEGGAFAITEHLLNLGHRTILYLGGPTNLSTSHARIRGFTRALRGRGLPETPELIRTGAFGRQWAYREMLKVLDEGELEFTAVFAANDIVAAGVYAAIKERGLSIPGDLSVVGYDDVPIAAELEPPLSTVRVPLEALGREAVRIGLAQAGTDSDPFAGSTAPAVLGTYVVVRDSAAPPSA